LGVLCYDEAPRERTNWQKETGRCLGLFIASFSRKLSPIHFPLVFFFPFNHYQWFYRGRKCEAYFPEPKVQKL
jgi:hypothetical protein